MTISDQRLVRAEPHFLCPPWSGRFGVEVYSTTRLGGVSLPPFDSLNLGLHVDDVAASVIENRQILKRSLSLKQEPLWLNQVHGSAIVKAEEQQQLFSIRRSASSGKPTPPEADAAWTQQRNLPLSVLTADCLPVVLATGAHSEYSVEQKSIAVIHAGWRGLAAGVLQNAIDALDAKPSSIAVWLGPAIGPQQFEVGTDVLEAFLAVLPGCEATCFTPHPAKAHEGKWLCDLYALARRILTKRGITEISGGNHCTFSDSGLFFSHRRDQGETGRLATVALIRGN